MKKAPLFITLIGSETYNLLKDLIYPVKPETKKFEKIVIVLKKHLCPKKKLIIKERFKFYKSQQSKNSQSVSEYIVEIKKLLMILEHFLIMLFETS